MRRPRESSRCARSFEPSIPQATARALSLASVVVLVLSFAPRAIPDQNTNGVTGAKTRNIDRASELHQQSLELCKAKRYQEAIAVAEEALRLREASLGRKHADTATSLHHLGTICRHLNEPARAEKCFLEALEIFNATLGPAHEDTGTCFYSLVDLYERGSDRVKLEALYERALATCEEALGPDSPTTAVCLRNLADFRKATGDYTRSETLYQRALAVLDNALGPDSQETITTRDSFADLYVRRRDFPKAIALHRQSLASREKTNGPDHQDTAASLNLLARAHHGNGDLELAETLYKRAIAINEKILGPDHGNTRVAMRNLAGLYVARRDYSAAKPLYERVLASRRKTRGPDHRDTMQSLEDLAYLHRLTGEYPKAVELYEEALRVIEKLKGPDHQDTAKRLNCLAIAHHGALEYPKAEDLYKRAIAIREKALGPNHEFTRLTLRNLGQLYADQNKFVESEALYRRAQLGEDDGLGAESADSLRGLDSLASLYSGIHDYAKAIPLLERAVAISERKYGPDHIETGERLRALGAGKHFGGRDPKEALSLYERALLIFEKTHGAEGRELIVLLNGMAMAHQHLDDSASAKACYERGLSISEKHRDRFGLKMFSAGLTGLHVRLGDYGAAQMACERMMEMGDTTTRWVLVMYSDVLLGTGQPMEALEQRMKLLSGDQTRRRVMAFATERQMSSFLKDFVTDMQQNYSIVAEHLPESPAARRHAAEISLELKGMALDALSRRRADVAAAEAPELKGLFDNWQKACQALVDHSISEARPSEGEAHARRLIALGEDVDVAETALARASSQFATARSSARIKLADVARALPADSAWVDIVRYDSFRFLETGANRNWGNARYIALVLRGGQDGSEPDVGLAQLGSQRVVDATVANWIAAARSPANGGHVRQEVAGKKLSSLVWERIKPLLGSCRRIYVSPDGELAFVSFAALPSDRPTGFLADEYEFAYLGSGRDVIPRQGDGKGGAPLLVGAPNFGDISGAGATSNQGQPTAPAVASADVMDSRALAAVRFPPLPGASEEVDGIAAILHDLGEQPVTLKGGVAEERAVRSARHPKILHLATHGFYLSGSQPVAMVSVFGQRGPGGIRPPETAPSGTANAAPANPMHRSGVALAGANDAICGRRPLGENDGILTAAEVAGMDLWGTRLVTISACESGRGQPVGSEGVYGLRRGFMVAGAENLIASLWPVSDSATRELMISLYRHLAPAGSAQRALIAAQREWISKEREAGRFPHPFFWAAFLGNGIGLTLDGPPLAAPRVLPPLAPLEAQPAPPPALAFTNSLGMRFTSVPGTSVMFSIWEARVSDFAAFVKDSGYHWNEKAPFQQGPDHPVVMVSWDDATAFCEWLSRKEGRQYRLPNDAEWDAACGTGVFPWGDEWPPPANSENIAGEESVLGKPDDPTGGGVLHGYRDNHARTAPVGAHAPSRSGLYDLGGNVREWIGDWFTAELYEQHVGGGGPPFKSEDVDAVTKGNLRGITRGGTWKTPDFRYLLSCSRFPSSRRGRTGNIGFRCVLVQE